MYGILKTKIIPTALKHLIDEIKNATNTSQIIVHDDVWIETMYTKNGQQLSVKLVILAKKNNKPVTLKENLSFICSNKIATKVANGKISQNESNRIAEKAIKSNIKYLINKIIAK